MRSESDLLGIMISSIEDSRSLQEKRTFQRMSVYAIPLALQVCIFSISSVRWAEQRIEALWFEPQKKLWERRIVPFPQVIYDRCFIRTTVERKFHRQCIDRFRAAGVPLLSSGLKGKWAVQAALQRNQELVGLLPETIRLDRMETLAHWLSNRNHAFLKPLSGSRGRGTIQISVQKNGLYTMNARDHRNHPLHIQQADVPSLFSSIRSLIGQREYLLQPDLGLTCQEGRAFDIRALVQKDSAGEWTLTGMGVRRGQPGSATANLHGGGTAEEVLPFLVKQFGSQQADRLHHQLLHAVRHVPETIEHAFGRFYELGIDFGIDRLGRLWLLEVNSKPGRSIFAKLGDHRKRSMSLCKPLLYARYLMNRRPGTGHASLTFRRVT